MGREKLFSAPGSILIKTTLFKLLAEAAYSAHRQRSYRNKYGEMWPNGQSSLYSALAHFWGGVLVLQSVEMETSLHGEWFYYNDESNLVEEIQLLEFFFWI